MSKGYTTVQDIAVAIKQTLTPEQLSQAEGLIEAAERQIDRYTGRAWLTGSVVEDVYTTNGTDVWLHDAPVASVTSIVRRSAMDDDDPYTLVPTTDYELQDLATGRLRIVSWLGFDRFRVTYVPSAAMPADIALAAKMMAINWMRPTLEGVGMGIQSYSIGGELSVTYATGMADGGMPPEIVALLRPYQRLVIA